MNHNRQIYFLIALSALATVAVIAGWGSCERKNKSVSYPTINDLAAVILVIDHGYPLSDVSERTRQRFRKIYDEASRIEDARKRAAKDRRKVSAARFTFSEVTA